MIIPQMNANERKCYLVGSTNRNDECKIPRVSSVCSVKNNINYSRSFAFICGK